jgi:serine/threonine-protein kinase
LTHPHICTLYDVGEHPSHDSGPTTLYLVMEHLTGETLAARLERGRLPLQQALAVATDIAEALSAAHRQGVVHRDLKPGNVMLTKSGAKLLDFGLAKLKGHGEQPAAGQVQPSADSSLTTEGRVVGTLHYMAPEQLEGKPADARTDVWAFGVLLHEIFTGKRAFEGTSSASLTAAILEREPAALSALAPAVPLSLERLVLQCLAKSPDDRPDTAHDVANELRRITQAGASGPRDAVEPRRLGFARAVGRVAVWASLVGAGVLAAIWLLPTRNPPGPVVRSVIQVTPADELNSGGVSPANLPTPGGSRTALAWTPDGALLVFVGRRAGVQQLYVRRLDATEARPLSNTENAQAPAVSPDGQYVAFWATGAIRKVPIGGGPVTEVVPGVPVPPNGLVWDAEGRLFFGRNDGRIWMVPAEGSPFRVTTATRGEELGQMHPFPLPGGRVLLYTAAKGWSSWSGYEVVALTLATGERKSLIPAAADARYLPTGHLVFLRRGILFAVPFDPGRLELLGPEAPVLDGVAQALSGGHTDDVTRAGHFAVSPTGTLAWIAAPPVPYEEGQLVAVDLRGVTSPLSAPTWTYGLSPRVSPDGRRLAVTARTPTGTGLWVYDLARSAPLPLPVGGEIGWPVWTPDGRHLVFYWLRDGRRSLAMQAADGTTPPEDLGLLATPSSFTPDGRLAAVVYRTGPGWGDAPDIALVSIQDGKAREEPLVHTPYGEGWPEFSPRGDWLVYGSNLSGRDEIYVQPYPGPGGAVPVTVGGGSSPAWHPNGREIFFLSPPGPDGMRRMMTVSFIPGLPPRLGQPKELFAFNPNELPMACDFFVRCYDVAPDGRRFYAVKRTMPPRAPAVTQINLVQNWFEELNALHASAR